MLFAIKDLLSFTQKQKGGQFQKSNKVQTCMISYVRYIKIMHESKKLKIRDHWYAIFCIRKIEKGFLMQI